MNAQAAAANIQIERNGINTLYEDVFASGRSMMVAYGKAAKQSDKAIQAMKALEPIEMTIAIHARTKNWFDFFWQVFFSKLKRKLNV